MTTLPIFYLIRGLGSLTKRATLSADNRYTPWNSVYSYLMGHAGDAIINFVVSLGLFLWIWRDTTPLNDVLAWVGIHAHLSGPIGPFSAAIYGVFSEQCVDLIISKGSKLFALSTIQKS